jgi:hypothetical protein
LLILLVCLFLFSLSIPLANGQMGGVGYEEPIAFSIRELAGFNRIFHTSPAQQAASESLLDAANAELKLQEAKAIQIGEAYRAIPKDKRTPDAREKFIKEANAAEPDVAASRRKILLDLRAILDQKQDADWPRFQRFLTRARWQAHDTGWGGEKTNLLGLIEKLNLESPDRATLNELLDRYERDLDPLLLELERRYTEKNKAHSEIWQREQKTGVPELDARRIAAADYAAAFHRLTQLNDNFAQRITPLLPETKRTEWRTLYDQSTLTESFGGFWHHVDQAYRSAADMPGLSDDTRDAIRRYLPTYTAPYDDLTAKIAAMERRLRVAGADDHVDTTDWDPFRLRRHDLQSAAQEFLKKLITHAQFDHLVHAYSDSNNSWQDAMVR